MLDLTQAVQGGNTNVSPSDAIFIELGRNTYDYKDLISELIDNSLAARLPNALLEVTIDVYVDNDGRPQRFTIRDNAAGIPPDRLGSAISPAAVRAENALNEHGLGMKQAIAALGRLDYLATKTAAEGQARVIREFKFGNIPTLRCNVDFQHGTEISVTNVSSVVDGAPINYTRSLVPYLGARYRRFLRADNRVMNCTINRRSINAPYNVINTWQLSEEKPVYFHIGTRTNQPVILNFPITSDTGAWEARLTFGYAPKEDAEYQELGLNPPSRFNPYHVSLSKQGLDVIRSDRVIMFAQLAELELITARHNDFNDIRGEIDLIRGFATATTKNAIIHDTAFRECISKIKDILSGAAPGPGGEARPYLVRRTFPADIPEKLLRDRLANWLLTNPLQRREQAHTEYVIEGIEGYIDIRTETEAWELKTVQADARDVYQLFMYMDVGGIDLGFLVAPSFSPGCQVAVNFIQEHHDKEIRLAAQNTLPINDPPNAQEREEYY